jgi:uncharacterized membrane protein
MRSTNPFRPLLVRPRLLIGIMLGITVRLLLPADLGAARTILALDLAGLCFLTLTLLMMARATPDKMRQRARLQDEGRLAILMLTIGAACYSLLAIGFELHDLKTLSPGLAWLHLALAAASLGCAWLVTHTLFALHYAHGFYGDDQDDTTDLVRGGLVFPECPQPDYWDFMYFAVVVGMTCQTSDVAVSSASMRRLCLAHGLLSFFFNTVILAMSINIAAGLI